MDIENNYQWQKKKGKKKKNCKVNVCMVVLGSLLW